MCNYKFSEKPLCQLEVGELGSIREGGKPDLIAALVEVTRITVTDPSGVGNE